MTEASEATIQPSAQEDKVPIRSPRNPHLTGQIIWGAMEDMRSQGQVITRTVLAEVTGFKMTIVDDHLTRLVDQGRLRRPLAGVFEIVEQHPEPRAVSITMLPGGLSKLEIGELCADLYPQERRMLASLLVGDAVQYSNIQAGRELNGTVGLVWEELKKLKRDLGGE